METAAYFYRFNIFMTEARQVIQTPIGKIAIHATAEAVTAVLFVKNNAEQEVLNATESDHPLIKKCIVQLNEYFEGTRRIFDLPLQQQGSAFQQSVWSQLIKINYGKTISYLELSKRIGDVKAIRAVGTTNGKNQIAIIVPCHRVIGSDGSLTGYGGELWRKKWLLEH